MRTCGALVQLLGCCPGSTMAVLVTHGRDAGCSCLRAGGVSWAQWRRLQQAGWSWLPGLSGVTESGLLRGPGGGPGRD